MKKSWLLGICLALVLGLSTSPAMAQDVIKMGASVSLTGAQSRFGNMVKTGYEMWKDYVNDAGGINVGGKKYKVAVVFYDDQSDPTVSAKLTEKLIT
jgi:branched-chain amino acid transport system substrate-binding protein